MSSAGERRSRLAAVREHPDFPEAMRHRPRAAGLTLRLGCQGLAGVAALAVAVAFLLFVERSAPGLPGPDDLPRIVLLGILAVAAGIAVWSLARLLRFGVSRLVRFPAVVVDKRQHVSRHGGSSAATATTYYVTLELEDGERRELEAGGKLYGRLGAGDAGVAYVRGTHLIDHRRLDNGVG